MTWTRTVLMFVVAACTTMARAEDRSAGVPQAVDLTKIDRSIAKEPKYSQEPRYELLVFGEKAEFRVWLALDGETLYVDRNGNGDLTEPGEAIKNTGTNSPAFVVDSIKSPSGAAYANLRVAKAIPGMSVSVNVVGKGPQLLRPIEGHPPKFAATTKEAPIIHLDGPLQIVQYREDRVFSRAAQTGGYQNRNRALRIVIGTPGLGAGTFAAFHCSLCDKRGPLSAKYEFSSSSGTAVEHTDALMKVG